MSRQLLSELPTDFDRLAFEDEITMMVQELAKMPAPRDGVLDVDDYIKILNGCTGYGLATALKEYLHGKHGKFMPTPTEIRISHDAIMQPIYATRSRIAREDADQEKQSQYRRSIADRTAEQREKVHTIYQAFVERHEAQKALDIETRIRKQGDDAKLFLSKAEFKAMQAKTPELHRGG